MQQGRESEGDCGYKGSRNYSYRKWNCRCDVCKRAYSEYRKRARREGADWVTRDRERHAERMRERRAAGERI